jgi:hypothetical protein
MARRYGVSSGKQVAKALREMKRVSLEVVAAAGR